MIARNDGAYLYLIHINTGILTFFDIAGGCEEQADFPPALHDHPVFAKKFVIPV